MHLAFRSIAWWGLVEWHQKRVLVVVVAHRQDAQAVGDSLRWDGSRAHPGVQEVLVVLGDQEVVRSVVRSSIRGGCTSEVVLVVRVPADPTWCGCEHRCVLRCHGAASHSEQSRTCPIAWWCHCIWEYFCVTWLLCQEDCLCL